jgi:hypothetical protein
MLKGEAEVPARHLTRSVACCAAAALFLAWLVGCGRNSTGVQVHVVPLTQAEERLKWIAMAYGDANSKNDKPPTGPEDLKPFLKDHGNPDEILVSPNDNQPFVIVWGKAPAGGPTEYKGLFPVLAYERKGSGGARAVTDIRGRPLTVPAEDFAKLKFVGGHVPAAD